MKEQIICEGPLGQVRDKIIAMRANARENHGWIMDIYVLRKEK
jgi:precorrin-6A synthase